MAEEIGVNREIQKAVGNLLRWGVIISMVVAFIGGVVYIYRHGGEKPNYATFKISETSYSSVGQVFAGILDFKGRAIILLGVLLLIFTPIFRIVLAIISFLFEKDYLYVLIGVIVLAIISISLFGGFTH